MGWGRNDQNSGIAHRWAHQLPTEKGRNKGTLYEANRLKNFYRDGLTIYSYGSHFPIATLHRKKENGDYTVLFTLDSYSNTTSGHKGEVRSAVSHLQTIYCKGPKRAADGLHSENLKHWENEAEKQYNHIAKAKKPELYFSAIESLRNEMQVYCKYFGITKKNNSILNSLKYIWLKPTKKVIAEAKERAKKETEAKKKAKAMQEAREKQLAETLKIVRPAVIEAWRNFKPYIGKGLPMEGLEKGKEQKLGLSLDYKYTGENTLLRINRETQNIETSKGISIPFEVAQRFYKWLQRIRKNGGCSGDCKHEILGYGVREVNESGFVVGCHDITWTEAETTAKILNW